VISAERTSAEEVAESLTSEELQLMQGVLKIYQ
jgi:hypothetical protein